MKKILLTILILSLIAIPAFSADEWDKTVPLSTDTKISYPADVTANNEAIDRLLSQYPKGITLSYSSGSTIVASTGGVVCSNSDGSVRKFRNNTSTTNITFSDLDTGAEAASTTYYIYASGDADASTATFVISASSSSPTGVTYYKRIGSFYNNSSSNMEQVASDNINVILSSGTVANGATISLPSGWTDDQCSVIVSVGSYDGSGGSGAINKIYATQSSRVVTASMNLYNWVDGGTNQTKYGTANYLIGCTK